MTEGGERVLRVTAERLNSLLDLSSKSLVETQRLKPYLSSMQRLKRIQSQSARALDTLDGQLKTLDLNLEAQEALADIEVEGVSGGGLVKVIADAKTDRVLGVWCIASVAGTMIAQAAQAMEFGATSEDIAYTCHAHPTHSEAIKEAAMAVQGKPIHM